MSQAQQTKIVQLPRRGAPPADRRSSHVLCPGSRYKPHSAYRARAGDPSARRRRDSRRRVGRRLQRVRHRFQPADGRRRRRRDRRRPGARARPGPLFDLLMAAAAPEKVLRTPRTPAPAKALRVRAPARALETLGAEAQRHPDHQARSINPRTRSRCSTCPAPSSDADPRRPPAPVSTSPNSRSGGTIHATARQRHKVPSAARAKEQDQSALASEADLPDHALQHADRQQDHRATAGLSQGYDLRQGRHLRAPGHDNRCTVLGPCRARLRANEPWAGYDGLARGTRSRQRSRRPTMTAPRPLAARRGHEGGAGARS